MFALVINDAVNAISRTPRRTTGDTTWLPLIEDPTTHDPYARQVPDGYDIAEDHVTRRWRTVVDPAVRVIEAFDRQQEAQTQALTAAGRVDGGEWAQPTGAHDAYPLDWTVTHGGKTWVSRLMSNVWEPGVTGWDEVVVEGEYPEWVQPLGAHDAYPEGAIVRHNGALWRNDHTSNVWEPGTPGSQWTQIEVVE